MTTLVSAVFYTSEEGGDWLRFDGYRPHRTAAAIVFADGWVFDVVLGIWREQFDVAVLEAAHRHLDKVARLNEQRGRHANDG